MNDLFPRMTVDREVDAAYIELNQRDVVRSVHLDYGIVVDLDESDRPVGYEVLSLDPEGIQ